MNRLAVIAKRYSYAATAALLTAAMLLPAFIMGSAGAEQLENRSVEVSSSKVGEAAVTYHITFTPTATEIGGVVVDFCTGPIPGTTCTSAGVVVGSTVADTDGLSETWTAAASGTKLTLSTTTPETPAGAITFSVSGFTNPGTAQTVYPRIFTYATAGAAAGYTSGTVTGTYIDNGSAAFAVVQEIDVTAIVRETLTFCVSGTAVATAASCASATTPSVDLGDEQDNVHVIDALDVHTASIYYHLSTNAANGTKINLKGTNLNLVSGSASINSASTPTEIAAGTAAFGVRVDTPAVPEEGAALTRGADVAGAVADEYSVPSAVTGAYGAPLLQAAGPVLNAAGDITFGATASPNTPAGIYTAKYSLIATPSY